MHFFPLFYISGFWFRSYHYLWNVRIPFRNVYVLLFKKNEENIAEKVNSRQRISRILGLIQLLILNVNNCIVFIGDFVDVIQRTGIFGANEGNEFLRLLLNVDKINICSSGQIDVRLYLVNLKMVEHGWASPVHQHEITEQNRIDVCLRAMKYSTNRHIS